MWHAYFDNYAILCSSLVTLLAQFTTSELTHKASLFIQFIIANLKKICSICFSIDFFCIDNSCLAILKYN